MASTLKKKPPTLQFVFDHAQYKMVLLILSGENLQPKKRGKLADPYVKVTYGNKCTNKTKAVNKTLNPLWEEFFYFEPTENDNILLEVWDRCKISDDFMGMCEIPPRGVQKFEEVQDQWLELHPRKKKDDKVRGRLHVRYFFSCLPETRPLGRGVHTFYYQPIKSFIDTGDILLYDAIGIADTTIKLQSAAPYSRTGLIIKLPNKWTEEEELFVMEVTRNVDGMLDAFEERPKSGVCLFRLFERIHQVHANAVWISKQHNRLSFNQKKMVEDFVWTLHRTDDPFKHSLGGKGISFLYQNFGKREKNEMIDFYGAFMVGSCLDKGGLIDSNVDLRTLQPITLCGLPCFISPPMLIRIKGGEPRMSMIPQDNQVKYFTLSQFPPSWSKNEFSETTIHPAVQYNVQQNNHTSWNNDGSSNIDQYSNSIEPHSQIPFQDLSRPHSMNQFHAGHANGDAKVPFDAHQLHQLQQIQQMQAMQQQVQQGMQQNIPENMFQHHLNQNGPIPDEYVYPDPEPDFEEEDPSSARLGVYGSFDKEPTVYLTQYPVLGGPLNVPPSTEQLAQLKMSQDSSKSRVPMVQEQQQNDLRENRSSGLVQNQNSIVQT